jgi:hypothetical protein
MPHGDFEPTSYYLPNFEDRRRQLTGTIAPSSSGLMFLWGDNQLGRYRRFQAILPVSGNPPLTLHE